ncbi:MAG: TIGR00266 family protein [Zunongwangia sp.]|uniref:Tryptophan RNA-binding attenuator like protein n=2 Tax=Zunongwangia profunda TaxID=398743 RepID=D5BD52_ZUNPS|nr:TIGR00266 family protein [Zunongwangia profunda]MAC64548.1 TIGR00266 family protein [Flavobacteriaceae bacterium]MAO38407.1 TIGR00266 family protein [Zunongwangia sp.]ADF52732.1 tryptophan RNA-binding attenuator like protein [Zunongwangia profunda SM-A87]MAS72684.1 TIGR00266 family protein [Zunongwangia sp.]HCV82529.1 TIGR00266 family protein [Zunongwangia profunda]|tara:strand:- start:364 stop:1164 length:801 start_codon:yes stop_codon:yes gene_type:complete
MNSHEIDYEIFGEEMQYVELELDPQEAAIAEAGNFMMMDNGIKMDTIFGDGSKQNEGFLGKVLGAGKRLLTGESLFMTIFSNIGQGKKKISFASPYPGKIIPVDLTQFGGKFICQKDAFLCAAKGVSIGIEFSRKLGRGFFGGEGFIMQSLEGDGMAFVHAGGTMAKKELAVGEVLKVDTGCIIGFTQTVNYDIEFIGGIRNTFFGGEGLFFATLTGPGVVYVQSLPFSRLANRVLQAAPQAGGKDKGEGSILGGLGDILGGDNRF